MTNSGFDGEYWNVDAKTKNIVRFQFNHHTGYQTVSAWASCFPEDCEWGETELHVLNDEEESSHELHAFATWDFEPRLSHCLFKLVEDELTVEWISIRTEIPSSRKTLKFHKDAERSAAARNPDPLAKFKHMWDGSEPGWRLIQYSDRVSLVEFHFDETGPTRAEFPSILEFVGPFPDESEDDMWDRLRGCSGIGLATPLGPTKMNRLRTLEREANLNLTICTIEPDDYLVLTPKGNHFNWVAFLSYRRPVIERMLDADVPVVSGQLE